MAIKIRVTDEEIAQLGVVQAALDNGYDKYDARKEIKAIYVRGMIDATESLKRAYISPNTAGISRRQESLQRMLEAWS